METPPLWLAQPKALYVCQCLYFRQAVYMWVRPMACLSRLAVCFTILSRIVRGLYIAYADVWLPLDVTFEVQRVRDRQRLNQVYQLLGTKNAPVDA